MTDAKEEDAPDASEGNGVCGFPEGAYQLHVLVETGKNLDHDCEDSVDPLIKVKFMGMSKTTGSKSKITKSTLVTWDEHLFFDTPKLEKEEIESAIIEIEILNKGFFSSDLIGRFPVSATTIYNLDKHTVHNQTLSFTNPEAENKSKITGNISVSIQLTGPDDESLQLKIGTDKNAASKKPWMPASVKKKYKQLSIKIIKAVNVPKVTLMGMETIPKPYVKINVMGNDLKTTTQIMGVDKPKPEENEEEKKETEEGKNEDKKTEDGEEEEEVEESFDPECTWSQEIMFALEMPMTKDKLTFDFYHEQVGPIPDTLMSQMNLSAKEILKTDSSKNKDGSTNFVMKWVNLYGCNPLQASGKHADLQNSNPDIATTFKGSLLIEYWTRDIKHPEMLVKGIEEIGELDDAENKMADYKARLDKMDDPVKYNAAFEVGAGIALPDSKDYYLKVTIGEDQWETGAPKQGQADGYKNYCRWNHKEKNLPFTNIHPSLKTFPKLFIYLVQKGSFGMRDTPICYFVDEVANYTDHNAKLKWVQLKRDPAIGTVENDWDAGFIQFRLYVHEASEKGEYVGSEFEKPWKKQPRQRLTVHRVRCFIYQAFNLPPMDDTGASDPLVRVWNTKGEKIETPYNEQTNNPIFYCTKDVEMEFDQLEDAPPILLNVIDLDFGIFAGEDFIGRAVVFLKDIKFAEDDNIPRPQWFPVTERIDDAWDPETGPQILASFAKKDTSKVDDDYELNPEDIQLDQVIKLESGIPIKMPSLNIQGFNIEIMVLGLRDLVSTGLLPIKKAFVKFSVKSLLPPAAGKAVQEIFTEPKEGGDDPNIKTTLKFLVRIPGEHQYMPRMTCTIFDKLYFEGMAQPILGTFVLKLGDALRDTRMKDRYTVEEIIDLARVIDKATQMKKGAGAGDTLLQNINKVQEEEATDQVQPEEVKINVDEKAALGPLEDIESMDPDEQMEYIQKLELRKQRLLEKQTFMKEQDLKRQKEVEARKKAEEAIADNKDAVHNVIYPKYKWDERLGIDREDQVPDMSLFVEIGYNRAPRDGLKHYRRYYTKELEKMTDLMPPSPFLAVPAYRTKKDDGLFGTGETTSVLTGKFKGLVKVFREEFRIKRDILIEENFQKLYQVVEAAYKSQMIMPSDEPFDFDWKQLQDLDNATEAFEKLKELCHRCGLTKLGVHTIIKNYNFDINLQKKLETVSKAKVRLYMIEGFNFAQKSMFSASDPFLIIRCGKTIFNERENYQLNTASPQLHKAYDFNIEVPGAPVLRIEALDYDDFFGDDLIGVTKIDLDDRYYNKEWSTIEHKPVEQRGLYHPDSTFSQGVVKMWMELYKGLGTKSAEAPPVIDITPEPIIEYEMRLVIWKTRDVQATDFELTSDHYIRTYVNPDESHYTDTHWRCHTGKGSFNWRNLIKVPTKQQQYLLTVQLWDKDIISSDELLGEFIIDIGPMFEDVQALNKQKVFNEKYWLEYMEEELINRGCDNTVDVEWNDDEDEQKKKTNTREQFWLPMRRANNNPEGGPEEYKDMDELEGGHVLCSFSIIPPEDAEKTPQGAGRESPNNDPFCPEPEGRMSLSLNPFAMLAQLVPPKMLAKIKNGCGCFLCCVICCGMCMACFPFIGIFL